MVFIVWLNGCSSSGKSSVAKALQSTLIDVTKSPMWLCFSIDNVLPCLPAFLIGRPRSGPIPTYWQGAAPPDDHKPIIYWKKLSENPPKHDVICEPESESFFVGMYACVAALAKQGNNVIFDDVVIAQGTLRQQILEKVEKMFLDLSECTLIKVKVNAALQLVEVREKQRGDRVIGQARAHYEYCHDGMQYDCEVDTGNNTIEENAKFIAYRVFQSLSTKPPFISCKKIIISRHGETCSNLKGTLQGWHDDPLTALGHQQAQELAQRLKSFPIDFIASSDLSRAFLTAKAVADVKGMEVHTIKNLREWHQHQYLDSAPGGETAETVCEHQVRFYLFSQACRRTVDTIKSVAQDANIKCPLLVAHAGVLRFALAELLGEDLITKYMGNTALNILEYDGMIFRAVSLNDCSHLSTITTNKF